MTTTKTAERIEWEGLHAELQQFVAIEDMAEWERVAGDLADRVGRAYSRMQWAERRK